MKVLVINCGSSSIKYQLLDMETEALLLKGLVERIGIEGSILTQKRPEADGSETKFVIETPMKDHKDAIQHVMDAIVDPDKGAIKSLDEINAIGHRVVHAGEKYANSVLISDSVIKALQDCIDLAPLHNPPNLDGIEACRSLMPGIPMVAVFDTAFHQTMRPEVYLYAIPYEFYEKYGIRKYGFHGTSHKYMAAEVAEMMNIDVNDLKLITCHLGNGASVSAIKHGRCIDTSMGYTPLEGLVMGTRCGDLDPSVVKTICNRTGLSDNEVLDILNTKSGLLGVSGLSSDFRDLRTAAAEGHKRAEIAIRIFARRVRNYIGAYIAEMNGVDAIVFSGGIGENAAEMRNRICLNMGNLGIKIDQHRNEECVGNTAMISTDDSPVKVMVIPANEELVIARETDELVRKSRV